MRYHDFHLQGYAVSEGGLKVELHLVWPYPGPSQRDSRLEFTDVACYHFTHTSGTILTDIAEEPLSAFVTSEHAFLSDAAELQGLRLWERDETQYLLREAIPLHDEVPGPCLASAGEFRFLFEQVKGHLRMVANDGLLSDPVECGHGMSALS